MLIGEEAYNYFINVQQYSSNNKQIIMQFWLPIHIASELFLYIIY